MPIFIVLLALLPIAAGADTLGIYAGAYHWSQQWDGSAQDGGDRIDIDRQLGYDSDNGNVIYVRFEHPLPLLPNLRLRRSEVETSGRSNSALAFDGQNFGAGARSTTDLGNTDVTAYYEVLDNVVSLDIGLTARHLDGEIKLEDGSQTGSADIEGWVPMGYLGVRMDLPFSGLYAASSIDALSIGGDGVEDIELVLGWESPLGIGIEAGYRRFSLDYEDGSEEADITIDGGFIGAIFHF